MSGRKGTRASPRAARERAFWEDHHGRARMTYPTEEVVRFLAVIFAEGGGGRRALDLGAGSGRHTVLLSRWGFRAFGLDYSLQAALNVQAFLAHEGLAGYGACGAKAQLPFRDNTFAVVLPWESLFYGDARDVAQAAAEVGRVLQPGGWCFANLRSAEDSHVEEAEELAPGTYLGRGEWKGLVFTLFDERTARELFAPTLELVWFDRYLVTRRNGARRDAGWILLGRKK